MRMHNSSSFEWYTSKEYVNHSLSLSLSHSRMFPCKVINCQSHAVPIPIVFHSRTTSNLVKNVRSCKHLLHRTAEPYVRRGWSWRFNVGRETEDKMNWHNLLRYITIAASCMICPQKKWKVVTHRHRKCVLIDPYERRTWTSADSSELNPHITIEFHFSKI